MLSTRIKSTELILAPVIFNAFTALLANRNGYAAGYVGGATTGYLRAVTEAALTPHDFVDLGTEIRSVTELPLIVDAGCGWGDPVHMRRNIRLLETSGYNAIELEDQVAPKRAHHHIGVEHLVSVETMVAKIEEAVRARTNPDTLIIARTNAVHVDLDDALRRCDAYASAGADMLFPITGKAELLPRLGEKSPLPLVQMVYPNQSFSQMGLSAKDLVSLNYRMLIDGLTPFVDMFRALEVSYAGLKTAPPRGEEIYKAMQDSNDLVGLPELLAIEKRTTERDGIVNGTGP